MPGMYCIAKNVESNFVAQRVIAYAVLHYMVTILIIVVVTIYRPFWAEVREKYFSTGSNRANMEAIEKAALILVFDDGTPNLSLYVSAIFALSQ